MSMGVADIGAFAANVASSVMIIFVNKLLMNFYGFNFAVTLSGLHYLTAALLMQGYKMTGLMSAKGVMPWKDRLIYTGVSSVSIISLNVSLLLNTVGFYQIAKLCVIPFVCVVEYFAYARYFSGPVMSSIGIVMAGVGLVTISDVSMNLGGLLVALLSIVAAGAPLLCCAYAVFCTIILSSQQLLCRHQQTTLGITSNEMLLYTAWPMAAFLLLVGPALDSVVTQGSWVFNFEYSVSNIIVIFATCVLAMGVNLSQFACLGRFTAVAYQVMGHTKTICVLIGGALLFHELITVRIATGMSLAVLGMVGYGYFTHREKLAATPEKTAANSPEKGEKGKGGDGETAVLLQNQPPSRADSNGVDGPEAGKLSPAPSQKLKD